jgi:hypothetical protein
MNYKIVKDKYGNDCCVLRSDGTSIPFDPDNTDYQEYLKWVEAGNTPEPADEQGA